MYFFIIYCSFLWRCGPTRAMTSSFLKFPDHTQRRITLGRTPLDEWSARHRDLFLTTHNTRNRQTSMPPVEFEPTISVGKRPQTYALDRAATSAFRQYTENKLCIKLIFLYTIDLVHWDRRTDMTKLIGAFCDYESALKYSSYSFFQSDMNPVATESVI